VQGQAMGTATTTLRREGTAWVGRTVVESPVMNQEATVRFGQDFTPIGTETLLSQGPMRIASDLRFANGRITGRAEFPAQAGGDREVNTEVVAGTLLPGMDGFVIQAAELREGRVITLPMFDVQSGTVSNTTFTVTGTDRITVPAGTFDVWRVAVTGPQELVLYIRRDGPPALVRQEILGLPVPVSLELTAIEG
jgi:hypothetical protein